MAGAWVSKRLRRVESKCSGQLFGFSDKSWEASDKKEEISRDRRLRRFTAWVVRFGGEISIRERIAEWSDGRLEVRDVDSTRGLEIAGLA